MKNKVVLMGYMGSGKSAVSKELAKLINLPSVDMDAFISQAENSPIEKIFKKKGEIYFRKLERKCLLDILYSERKFVLSLGGGTPCYGNNMEVIKATKDSVTIYLSASPETLTNRLFEEKSDRPLIAHLDSKVALLDFIRKHLFERIFYYNQADLIIKTDGNSLKEITEEIYKKLL